jgi:hypothetical protein
MFFLLSWKQNTHIIVIVWSYTKVLFRSFSLSPPHHSIRYGILWKKTTGNIQSKLEKKCLLFRPLISFHIFPIHIFFLPFSAFSFQHDAHMLAFFSLISLMFSRDSRAFFSFSIHRLSLVFFSSLFFYKCLFSWFSIFSALTNETWNEA